MCVFEGQNLHNKMCNKNEFYTYLYHFYTAMSVCVFLGGLAFVLFRCLFLFSFFCLQ